LRQEHFITHREVLSQEEQLDTLSGKLKFYCPALFSSLSSWERDTLDASCWLGSYTSKAACPSVLDRECAGPSLVCQNLSGDRVTLSVEVSGVEALRDSESLVQASVKEGHNGLTISPGGPNQLDETNLLSLTPSGDSDRQPGYREPDEGDSSLSVVLDSLVPFFRETKSPVPLPVFHGSSVYGKTKCGGEASTSNLCEEGVGKEYAWSRGLGIEYSPVKTRSAQKKEEVMTSMPSVSFPPTTDCGALRAMKALAREK
jgi:hypothetical protein